MMKSPLSKWRGLALYKHGHKQNKEDALAAHQDELLQAAEDINDIKNCYESLLSAAAGAANSAYEFSESLREYGSCLHEKNALNDDEECGRVLLMLGKTQFELQKIVDIYRVHVVQTITTPSESLLKELKTVEEMKRQCDDKRDLYKFMLAAQREKGKLRNAKSESFSPQQLRAAQEDYEEEATLFLFRLKSLKQGQSRSLLTQAARHHASQLNLFRKGVKSLEAVEPYVKVLAEKQHIDYQFSGLEEEQVGDYGGDEYHNDDGSRASSFGYGYYGQHHDVGSFSRNSMEEIVDKGQMDIFHHSKDPRAVSNSAPLFSNTKCRSSERTSQMQPSSYVLPTPLDVKCSTSTGSSNSTSGARNENKGGWPAQLWHSSPLQSNMLGKDGRYAEVPNATNLPPEHPVLEDSNIVSIPARMPSASKEGMLSKMSPSNMFDSKVIERHAFSGPLISTPSLFPTNSMSSMDPLPGVSKKPTGIPTPKVSMPQKVSPNASPPPATSPRINELHELPRPPVAYGKQRPSSLIGHSAPIVPRGQELYATNKPASVLPYTATPLPKPPTISRSFSIPSSGQRSSLTVANQLDLPCSQKSIPSSGQRSSLTVANQLDLPCSQKTTIDNSPPPAPLVNGGIAS